MKLKKDACSPTEGDWPGRKKLDRRSKPLRSLQKWKLNLSNYQDGCSHLAKKRKKYSSKRLTAKRSLYDKTGKRERLKNVFFKEKNCTCSRCCRWCIQAGACRGQFNKTVANLIYKCGYCFRVWKKKSYTWNVLWNLSQVVAWREFKCLGAVTTNAIIMLFSRGRIREPYFVKN